MYIKSQITIDRPVEFVWAFVTQGENWQRWNDARLVSVTPGWQIGAQMTWERGEADITAFIPRTLLEISTKVMKNSYRFSPAAEGGTLVELEMSTLGGASFSDGGKAQTAVNERHLKRLKQEVEGEIADSHSRKIYSDLKQYLEILAELFDAIHRGADRHQVNGLVEKLVVRDIGALTLDIASVKDEPALRLIDTDLRSLAGFADDILGEIKGRQQEFTPSLPILMLNIKMVAEAGLRDIGKRWLSAYQKRASADSPKTLRSHRRIFAILGGILLFSCISLFLVMLFSDPQPVNGPVPTEEIAITATPQSQVITRDNHLRLKSYATLKVEDGTLYDLAWSPDGATFAATGKDGIAIYDVSTLGLVRSMGSGKWVASVVFSPDGRLLAAGTSQPSLGVEVWDVRNGTLHMTLEGHTDTIHSVAFSPDGQTLASGSKDGTIKFWDMNTGQLIRTILVPVEVEWHTGVNDVAFSPDGLTLASGDEEGTVKLWDVKTGQLLASWKGPIPETNIAHADRVAFTRDGGVVAGGGNESLWAWRVDTGEPVITVLSTGRGVQSIAFSLDGSILVSGGYHTLHIWNARNGDLLNEIECHADSQVKGLVFSPDGRILLSGGGDGTILLWKIK